MKTPIRRTQWHLRWATVVAVAVASVTWLEVTHAAIVTYVGAEISSNDTGNWDSSALSGDKSNYRSTDDGTKSFTLPDHPNAYGREGYIMFGQSGASVPQEASGDFTGTIYTGTRSGQTFNNPAPGVASVAILGTGEAGLGTPSWPSGQGNWRIENTWNGNLDDASLGIGASVGDVINGTLWYRWNPLQTTNDLLRITLDGDAHVPTIRVGVLTDRGDKQKPGAIGLGGVWMTRLGANNYSLPDWYFFDITEPNAGQTVDISITPFDPEQWGSNIRGLVFDVVTVPEPSAVVLLGLGGLVVAWARRRNRR